MEQNGEHHYDIPRSHHFDFQFSIFNLAKPNPFDFALKAAAAFCAPLFP
jgi:hypothetical protein